MFEFIKRMFRAPVRPRPRVEFSENVYKTAKVRMVESSTTREGMLFNIHFQSKTFNSIDEAVNAVVEYDKGRITERARSDFKVVKSYDV